MPTGSEFALVTDKKLLGVRDFDTYLLKYLQGYVSESVKRLFVQGAFDERLPLSSPGAGQVQADLKPTAQDGFAHDGAGHLLDLEQIDRTANFPNVNGQTYEVGASFVEVPVGIRTNPRTGKFEYDHMIEGIGVQANPDNVTVDTSTLTFVVDALFESGVTPGNHTGRQVRVFSLFPGEAASSEAIAIETCTVFYDGQNKITTTGRLGRTAPETSAAFYVVQLIGLMVRADNADNRPSALPGEVFSIGTVEGNGGTPTVFDITGQNIIQAQAASAITVDPFSSWADGTANPGGTAQGVFDKIVTDLTSTIGARGAGKLTAPAIASDFIQVGADTLANQLVALADAISEQHHLRLFAIDVNGFIAPEAGSYSGPSAKPGGGGGRPGALAGFAYAVIYAGPDLFTHVRSATGTSDNVQIAGDGSTSHYGVVWHEALGLWVLVGESGGNLRITHAVIPTTGNFTVETAPWTGLPGSGIAITDAGRLIIVGNGGNTAWSDDAVTWNSVPSGVGTFLTSVAHGNGITVAVGANIAMRSSDEGLSWASAFGAVSGSSNSLVYYFRGLFYWLARNPLSGETAVLTSADGEVWASPAEFDNTGALDGTSAQACVTPDALIISTTTQVFAHPGGDEPWSYMFHRNTGLSTRTIPIATLVDEHGVAVFAIATGDDDIHYHSWAR